MSVELKRLSIRKSGTMILENCSRVIHSPLTILVGDNGAGKTTLLRAIVGLERPTSGTVEGPGPSGIGYLPQDPQFCGNPTVYDYLIFAGWTRKVKMKNLDNSVQAAMRTTSLSNYTNQKIGTLSGGTMQRVFIAEAIVSEPRCLLLDEPTVGLDFKQTSKVADAVLKYSRRHQLIVSSHDVGFVNLLRKDAEFLEVCDASLRSIQDSEEYFNDAY